MNEWDTPQERVFIKARVAVFTMYENRQIPNLTLESNFKEIENHPEFSHWGTDVFYVDVTPKQFEDEFLPPKHYA
jgi:hypothetical protein